MASAVRTFLNDDDIASVTYNPATKKATVTFTDDTYIEYDVNVNKVASQNIVAAAEMMTKVQAAIEAASSAADKPDASRVAVTISGNTMTLTPVSGANYYTKDPSGGTTHLPAAVHDLARFLGKLYTEADAEEIVYGPDTYEWNTTQAVTGDSASKWFKVGETTGKTNSLVGAITAAVGANSGSGYATTINITVDGYAMVIECEAGD